MPDANDFGFSDGDVNVNGHDTNQYVKDEVIIVQATGGVTFVSGNHFSVSTSLGGYLNSRYFEGTRSDGLNVRVGRPRRYLCTCPYQGLERDWVG